MVTENIMSHFGMWWAAALWIAIYGVFLLFVPFYKKSQIKPSGAYVAFIVAFALEMFGIPFSMFAIGWLFEYTLPEGILWGHTLVQYIGFWGMYVGILISLTGVASVISGWRGSIRITGVRKKVRGNLLQLAFINIFATRSTPAFL